MCLMFTLVHKQPLALFHEEGFFTSSIGFISYCAKGENFNQNLIIQLM